MTYGFRPESWPAFQRQLDARGITVADIERVEMRPQLASGSAGAATAMVDVTVTLRSGRVEAWRQPQREA
jgi:hypothetical protein